MLQWFAFILSGGLAVLVARVLFMRIGVNRSMIYLPYVHIIFIGILTLGVSSNYGDGQARLTWFPALILDFPTSLFTSATTEFVSRYSDDKYYAQIVTGPAIHYGVFGTLQYLAFGAYVDRKRKRLPNQAL
jgi:hypothetical protein